MTIRHFHAHDVEASEPNTSTAFMSLEEAHASFQYLSNQALQEWRGIRESGMTPELVTRHRRYLKIYLQWSLSLQAFIKSAGQSLSLAAEHASRVLQLNYLVLALQLDVGTRLASYGLATWEDDVSASRELSPMAWDGHLQQFQQIIALARRVVDFAIKLDTSNHCRKFSMHTSMVATLYFVVFACRDPLVRREAVALLHQSPQEEGLWPSTVTAQVCRKLIDVEEEGLGDVRWCEDVPRWARIQQVKLSLDAEGRLGKITYQKQGMRGEPYWGDFEVSFH